MVRKRPDAKKTPKIPAKRKGTLTKIATRALSATPEQIRMYIPQELDYSIAESMLAGAHTFQTIADAIPGTPIKRVSDAMRDSVRCAWISHAVHQMALQRVGMIDAAMMSRAVAGDVKAANLMYKRLDMMTTKSATIHVHGHVNDFQPDKLSDADLDRVITAKYKELEGGEPTNSDGGDEKDKDPPRADPGYFEKRYD